MRHCGKQSTGKAPAPKAQRQVGEGERSTGQKGASGDQWAGPLSQLPNCCARIGTEPLASKASDIRSRVQSVQCQGRGSRPDMCLYGKEYYLLIDGEVDHVSYGYGVAVLGIVCTKYDFALYIMGDFACTKFLSINMGVVPYVFGSIMHTTYISQGREHKPAVCLHGEEYYLLVDGEGDHVSNGYEVKILGVVHTRYDFELYDGVDHICAKYLPSDIGVGLYGIGIIMHAKYMHSLLHVVASMHFGLRALGHHAHDTRLLMLLLHIKGRYEGALVCNSSQGAELVWCAHGITRSTPARTWQFDEAYAGGMGRSGNGARQRWQLKGKCAVARRSAFAAVCADRRYLRVVHQSLGQLYKRCEDAPFVHDAATKNAKQARGLWKIEAKCLRGAITSLVPEPEIDDYWARAHVTHRHLTKRLALRRHTGCLARTWELSLRAGLDGLGKQARLREQHIGGLSLRALGRDTTAMGPEWVPGQHMCRCTHSVVVHTAIETGARDRRAERAEVSMRSAQHRMARVSAFGRWIACE